MTDARIGGAYVDIQARMDNFRNGMQEAHRATDGLGNAFGGMAKKIAAIGASIAIGAGLLKAISLAADLNETISFTGVVFGNSASIVTAEAEKMSKAFGTSKKEFLEGATSLGQNFKGIGASQEDAAKLGTWLSKLAIDMSSAKNSSYADAMGALDSAIRGNSDGLERYAMGFNAAKIEIEAMRMGYKKVGGEISDAAKQAATMSLIIKKSKDFQGDLLRTSESVSNSWRRVTGQVEDMATKFGEKLLPAVSATLQFAIEQFENLSESADGFYSVVESIASGIKDGFQTASVVLRNFGDVWEIVRLTTSAYLANIGNIWEVIPENLSRVATWMGSNWREMIADALNAIWAIFSNFANNIKELGTAIFNWITDPFSEFKPDFKGLMDGWKPTAAALPDMLTPTLTDYSKEIAEITDRMADREVKRLDDIAEKRKKMAEDLEKSKPDLDLFKKLEKKQNPDYDIYGGGSELKRRIQTAIFKETSIPAESLKELKGIREGISAIKDATTKSPDPLAKPGVTI